MTNCSPLSHLGTTMIGIDQLDLLLHITLAIRSFSISSFTHWWFLIAIRYGFWDTGSVLPVLMVISMRGVVPMDISSLANWEAYSFRSASSLDSTLDLILWQSGLKVSGSTCSAIIFWRVILFIEWASGWVWICVSLITLSSMAGSKHLYFLLY